MNEVSLSRDKKCCKLSKAASQKTFVFLAVVAAMGGVGCVDVAVAGFQLLKDGTFLDYTGTTIVCECSEEIFVFAIFLVQGTEFGIVFAKKCVSLCFG